MHNNFQQAAAATAQPSNNISQYSTNPCAVQTSVSGCAGCVQQLQQAGGPGYCSEAAQMEMTAILHSQPPLQLVSCHGPIMHPSTPSNQR